MQAGWILNAQRGLTIALFAAGVATFAGWWAKGRLPSPTSLRPELRREPVQTETRRAPFAFDYAGEHYAVRPRAEYELWGLVVSHNDPGGLGDIYHDDRSVDTRDLCVIFGDNTTRADYQKVEFSSGSWTCRYRYPDGVTLRLDGISNNHLVTDDAAVRATIGTIRIGDQVHVVGQLVDYQAASNPSFWRRTSLTRRDDEQGACEVVFVTALEVLERATPGWYAAHRFGLIAFALLALGKLLLFVGSVVARA